LSGVAGGEDIYVAGCFLPYAQNAWRQEANGDLVYVNKGIDSNQQKRAFYFRYRFQTEELRITGYVVDSEDDAIDESEIVASSRQDLPTPIVRPNEQQLEEGWETVQALLNGGAPSPFGAAAAGNEHATEFHSGDNAELQALLDWFLAGEAVPATGGFGRTLLALALCLSGSILTRRLRKGMRGAAWRPSGVPGRARWRL
jgi:hypothetical protein